MSVQWSTVGAGHPSGRRCTPPHALQQEPTHLGAGVLPPLQAPRMLSSVLPSFTGCPVLLACSTAACTQCKSWLNTTAQDAASGMERAKARHAAACSRPGQCAWQARALQASVHMQEGARPAHTLRNAISSAVFASSASSSCCWYLSHASSSSCVGSGPGHVHCSCSHGEPFACCTCAAAGEAPTSACARARAHARTHTCERTCSAMICSSRSFRRAVSAIMMSRCFSSSCL